MNKLSKLALASLLTISSLTMAQARSDMPMASAEAAPHHQRMPIEKLNLTEAQQAQLKALKESMKAEKASARQASEAAMNEFLNSPTFNAEQAEKLMQQQQNQRAVMQLKFKYEMNKILTPEQRALAEKTRGERQAPAPDKMMKKLQLTEAQKTQIEALKTSMKTEQEAAQKAGKAAMDAFLNSPTFDAAQAQKLVQQQQNERAVMQLKFKYEMNKILTPEQRELLQKEENRPQKGPKDGKNHQQQPQKKGAPQRNHNNNQ